MERRRHSPAGQEVPELGIQVKNSEKKPAKPLEKVLKKRAHEKRVKTRRSELHEHSFPDEEEKLARYDYPFMILARDNSPVNLDQALDFAKMWNNDPPHVRRAVESQLRESAINATQEIGKLKRYRSSSLENCLEILGGGNIPSTPHRVDQAIPDEADQSARDKLTDLREQLELARKTRGYRSSRLVIDGGLGIGPPALIPLGLRFNLGADFQPKDPSGHRRHDLFIQPSVKILGSLTPVVGFRDRGIEKSLTLGVGGAKGHPKKGNQLKTTPPFVGFAAGEKMSGFSLEAPLILLAPVASFLGAHELAAYIHSLGNLGYIIKPQIVANFQDERLRPIQEMAINVSAHIGARTEVIKDRLSRWKNEKKEVASLYLHNFLK